LEIVGSDRFAPAYGKFLRALVAERGLEEVVDLRFESVSEAELERAYARADIAVFPNEQQAWGLAQLEAMARGVAIVVSQGAGISEVLADGVDSLLVEARQPEQIARAIVQFASVPLRQRVAENGRRLVLEKYTSAQYARQMQALFRSCLPQVRVERA
jgi:spore coat protein SA